MTVGRIVQISNLSGLKNVNKKKCPRLAVMKLIRISAIAAKHRFLCWFVRYIWSEKGLLGTQKYVAIYSTFTNGS